MSDTRSHQTNRPADSRADLRSYLDIGRITAPHGIQGEVRVLPLTDQPERFDSLSDCFLTAPDERTRKPVRILGVRPNPPFLLVRIQGCDDRNAAELLRGWYLSVDRAHAIQLPEGSHFICDILGCEVVDSVHGSLGRLSDVLQNLGHDVYVVSNPGQPDLLFPAMKQIIHRVDMDARLIEVTLPDGLYEIYR